MEWVETTGKTVEEARDAALDQLGVGSDEAEFDIVEEPRPGLFGRMRGSARVRARVKPTPVRPKQDRRRRGKERSKPKSRNQSPADDASPATADEAAPESGGDRDGAASDGAPAGNGSDPERSGGGSSSRRRRQRSKPDGATNQPSSDEKSRKQAMSDQIDDAPTSDVTPQEVGDAAVAFMSGLTDAFGADASTELTIDGTDLAVSTTGSELGLLVGPSGRTLNAIQDLARVSAQRRLGDHVTRLRIDVAGYRERRQAALARFAQEVAESVRTSGSPRSLEPMSSADRKVIHDVLNDEDGVQSRSEGEDPNRRVVVLPS